jgi:hypothetical protein
VPDHKLGLFETPAQIGAAELQVVENMVDVTGIEPVTPCLQSRPGKILTALSGVAYTENQRNFRSLKCPEVVPNFSNQRIALLSGHICATILARIAVSGPETRVDGELHQVCQACGGFIRPIGPTARQDLNNAEHAIEGFARVRRFPNGRFTEDSIRKYLVMLRVGKTCGYQNIET